MFSIAYDLFTRICYQLQSQLGHNIVALAQGLRGYLSAYIAGLIFATVHSLSERVFVVFEETGSIFAH